MVQGRVLGKQRGISHTTWLKNTTKTRGGKEERKWEVRGRNGPKNTTHHQKTIVIGVLDKRRNQGGLKVVKKVGGGQVNQSINGGGPSKSNKAKNGRSEGEDDVAVQ